MTKREIERRAAEALARYSELRDRYSHTARERVGMTSRMIAILDFCESLGCKRSRIVAAVRAAEETSCTP